MRNLHLALIGALLMGSIAADETAEDMEKRYPLWLEEAVEYRMNNAPAEARELYLRITALSGLSDAQRIEVQLNVAHTYRQEEKYEEARSAYQAVADYPDAPMEYRCLALSCIADTYEAQGEYTTARDVCAALLTVPGLTEHLAWDAAQRIEDYERLAAGMPRWAIDRTRTPAPDLSEAAVVFYMAPDGDDENVGTKEKPLATLEGVRDSMRAARTKEPGLSGGVCAYVRGGVYPMNRSLVLDADDSGTRDAPTVFRAYPGETPRFTGGLVLKGFVPVADPSILERLPESSRDKVMQINLYEAGVAELGEITQRGMSIAGKPLLELFFDGTPMRIARWPNSGFAQVGAVHDIGSRDEGRGIVFDYEDDRPARWTQARDIWMLGYWYHHWADCTLDVAAIDTEHKRIHTTLTSPYTIREGQHYYYFNLLDEIEEPGEWYLDRETGVLYFYPPGDIRTATVELSVFREPMVVMDNAEHVYLQGLTFDVSGDTGVVIRGGARCALLGCTLSRLGNDAVQVQGGVDHLILGCDMFMLARKGVSAACGDRATLTPGNLIIENNHIHDFSRIDRSYTPAVWLDGVGNRIAHNLFHDSPHQAMRIEGNDHSIVFNEIHSVVYETDDQSGLDMWGDPSYRGNVINFNFWHHIGSPLERHGQAGIRLDDAICGVRMYGNVFYRSSGGSFGAIQIHGGKENIIDNNLFISCKYAVSFSQWPPHRWIEFLNGGMGLRNIRERVNIAEAPYADRYPELARIEEDPNVNYVRRNLAVNCGEFLYHGQNQVLMDNMASDTNPGFRAPGKRDFSIPEESWIHKTFSFRPIPFHLMGLYEDEFRASWPVAHHVSEGYAEETF